MLPLFADGGVNLGFSQEISGFARRSDIGAVTLARVGIRSLGKVRLTLRQIIEAILHLRGQLLGIPFPGTALLGEQFLG